MSQISDHRYVLLFAECPVSVGEKEYLADSQKRKWRASAGQVVLTYMRLTLDREMSRVGLILAAPVNDARSSETAEFKIVSPQAEAALRFV